VNKPVAILFICLCAAAAWAEPKLAQDRAGNLFQYWRSGNTLEVASLNGPQHALYVFTSEVSSFSLAVDNNSYALIFAASSEVGFTRSKNNGLDFPAPLILSANGHDPALAVSDNLALAAWEEEVTVDLNRTEKAIKLSRSVDQGLTWDPPTTVMISGETVSGPTIAIDALFNLHLVFLSYNKELDRHRLYYTSITSIEPKVIFESQDEIVSPRLALSPDSLLINWQTNYLGRKTTYLAVSLDEGKHFGTTRSLAWAKDQPDSLFYLNSKWQIFSFSATPDLNDFLLPALPVPVLIMPSNGSLTNLASPEIKFRSNNADPVTIKVELSREKAFSPNKTWAFDPFNLPSSAETDMRLPLNLPDGQYYLRLSASDGLSASPYSTLVSFNIDTQPPVISLTSPSAEVSDDDTVNFSGSVNEPVKLSLNGRPITVEANRSFLCLNPLISGLNNFELIATDEAGNTTRLVQLVAYSATVPHFKILRPKADDWFKPGSTIYFEAAINDSLNEIADEAEGEISVNGQVLADKPVYDISAKKLSGFISLPPDLMDGKNTASVRLQDGQKDFSLNIDKTPPSRVAASNEAVYTNSATLVPLPLNDTGSGLDLQGTLVKMNGVSLEAILTLEANPAARIKLPLADGSYEVIVFPRDNVGNTGEATNYRLIVDTLPPRLLVNHEQGTTANQPRLLISGEADDPHLAGLNFYNGQNLVGTINSAPAAFSYNFPLINGNNEIKVEAVDRAGNKTSQSFSVQAEIAPAGLITKFAAGPSPFSPKTDKTMYFTFTFSATPDLLRIYIFDLTGTLLWRKDLINYSGTSLAWNGVDLFGHPVDNGVYPYLAAVSLGGQTEIKKGKLIVLQ
jgi:hypothetical protein